MSVETSSFQKEMAQPGKVDPDKVPVPKPMPQIPDLPRPQPEKIPVPSTPEPEETPQDPGRKEPRVPA